jgi:Flp pilus assembly protein TadG
MLRQFRNSIHDKRGQAIVEFALVLPILLFLVFGIMEGGRVMFEQIIVTEAAREGARVAIVNTNNANITTAITTAVDKFGAGMITTITYRNATNNVVGTPVAGGTATVLVTANVPIVTPLMSAVFNPNPFPVSGTATMRME